MGTDANVEDEISSAPIRTTLYHRGYGESSTRNPNSPAAIIRVGFSSVYWDMRR